MYLTIDVETAYMERSYPYNPASYLTSIAAWNGLRSYFWLFRHKDNDAKKGDKECIAELQALIDKSSIIVAHNMKYDAHWLKWLGVELQHKRLWCTSVAEYILSGQTWQYPSLNDVAAKRLSSHKLDKVKELWDTGVETKNIPLEILQEYNVEDCRLTYAIFEQQLQEVRSLGMEPLSRIEMEKIKCLVDIEMNGMSIDLVMLKQKGAELREQLSTEVKKIQELAGWDVNISSPIQLSALLFGGEYTEKQRVKYEVTLKDGTRKERERWENVTIQREGLKFIPNPEWKNKKGYSVGKDVLTMLAGQAREMGPVGKALLDGLLLTSHLEQQLSTFVGGITSRHVQGVIHPEMNNTRTSTARLSSSNPNMQNIPRDKTSTIKQVFVPSLKHGLLVEGDASALEWRIAAVLSQCPVMMEEILNDRDPHAATGRDVFKGKGTRTDWKIFNFRMIYGGSAYSFFMDTKMPSFSQKKWTQIVEAFYEKYYGLKRWHDSLVESVIRNNGLLINPTGRRFLFTKAQGRYGEEYRRPQILNYPVQSLATGDIIPLVMVYVASTIKARRLRAKLVNQVHDSIIYDCHEEDADEVARIMLHYFRAIPDLMRKHYNMNFNVPMDGEIKMGRNWYDTTKYEG